MDKERQAVIDYLLSPESKPQPNFQYSTETDPYYETDKDRANRSEARRLNAEALQSMALTAADPLQLPSAVTGLISPELRDGWRERADRSAVGQLLGLLAQMPGYGAGLKALEKMGGAGRQLLAAGTTTAASDIIDKRGEVDGETLKRGAYGAIMPFAANRLQPSNSTKAAALAAALLANPSRDGDER